MNTRILGFNASIEASRAKESGKGFGVIAQEVRSLADVSKSSADKIVDTIQAIGADTDEIVHYIKTTSEIVEKNIEYTRSIAELLKEISQKIK
ncbi:MAG: methyl-accepting chemotaxis protein [Clostridiales bacterium]|nr:methyl-accepting chemotaxis protein [Clostridiales bacterium]